MITRVEIDGFKSLRGFAIDLEPLTAVVGPNGVGKSNLFDALRLMSCLATTDVSSAFGSGRGSRRDQFSRTREGAITRMSLALEVLLAVDAAQTRFRVELDIERNPEPTGVERLLVRRFKTAAIRQADDTWILKHPDFARFTRYGQEQACVELSAKPEDPESRQVSLPRVLDNPVVMRGGEFLPMIGTELRFFRFLHLDPQRLRLSSDRAAPTTLGSDGSNLPTVLMDLLPGVRAEIRADVARLVPSFRSFDIVSIDDELRLEVELTTGQRLPARVLSDGTLRLLGLFTLLRTMPSGSVIAIEEPENGVHTASLHALVEELVATTAANAELPPQVLLNSHSPGIVAALQQQPQSLIVADLVRRVDGLQVTRMRHIQAQGDSSDRGATMASRREIERLLATIRPADEST